MKGIRVLSSALVVTSLLCVMGCGRADGSHESQADGSKQMEEQLRQLEEQRQQMEQEIAELKKQLADNIAGGQTAPDTVAAPGGQTAPDTVAAPGGQTAPDTETASGGQTSDKIQALTKAVDDIVAKVDAAVPAEGSEEKRRQFFELKDALDLVERQLDGYDDDMEFEYKRGKLSYDSYRVIERELDALDDKLDAAEDRLERVFGIDD